MNTTHGDHAAHESHACCHDGTQAQPKAAPAHPAAHDAHAGHAAQGGLRGAISVTLHCLTGCSIGELLGLAVGVSLGWPPRHTVTLAVILSFVSGFALTLIPMMRRGFGLADSLRTVWLGEVISISVMEVVMNLVDYQMGGMRGVSLSSPLYWQAFAQALVAGFLAALPVNAWMLNRNMKRCH